MPVHSRSPLAGSTLASSQHGAVVLRRTYANKTKLLYEDGHVEEIYRTDLPAEAGGASKSARALATGATPKRSARAAPSVSSSTKIPSTAHTYDAPARLASTTGGFSSPTNTDPRQSARLPEGRDAGQAVAPVGEAQVVGTASRGQGSRGCEEGGVDAAGTSASHPSAVSPAGLSSSPRGFRQGALVRVKSLTSTDVGSAPVRTGTSAYVANGRGRDARAPPPLRLTADAVDSDGVFLTDVATLPMTVTSTRAETRRPPARLASWRITHADGTVTNAMTLSSSTAHSARLARRLAEMRVRRAEKRAAAHRVLKPHAPSMLSIELPLITAEGELRTPVVTAEADGEDGTVQSHQPDGAPATSTSEATKPLKRYPDGSTPVEVYERIVTRERDAMLTRLSGLDINRFMHTSPEASRVALLYFWFVVLRSRRSFVEHLLEGRYKLLLGAYRELFPRRRNTRLPSLDHLDLLVDELLLSGEQWKMEEEEHGEVDDEDQETLQTRETGAAPAQQSSKARRTAAMTDPRGVSVTTDAAQQRRQRRHLDAFYRENGYALLASQPELHRAGVPPPLDVVWRVADALDALTASRDEFEQVQRREERCFHGLAVQFGHLFLGLKHQKDSILESYEHVVAHITHYALRFNFINDAHGHIFNDDFRVDLLRLFHYWCSGLVVTQVPSRQWPTPQPQDVAAAYKAAQQQLTLKEETLWTALDPQDDDEANRLDPQRGTSAAPVSRELAAVLTAKHTRTCKESPVARLATHLSPPTTEADGGHITCVGGSDSDGSHAQPQNASREPSSTHSPTCTCLPDERSSAAIVDDAREDAQHDHIVEDGHSMKLLTQETDPLAGVATMAPRQSPVVSGATRWRSSFSCATPRSLSRATSADTATATTSPTRRLNAGGGDERDITLPSLLAVKSEKNTRGDATGRSGRAGRHVQSHCLVEPSTSIRAERSTTEQNKSHQGSREHISETSSARRTSFHGLGPQSLVPSKRARKPERVVRALQPLAGEEDFDDLDIEVANGEYRLISKFARYAQHANHLMDELERRVQRQHQRQVRKNRLLGKTVDQSRQQLHLQQQQQQQRQQDLAVRNGTQLDVEGHAESSGVLNAERDGTPVVNGHTSRGVAAVGSGAAAGSVPLMRWAFSVPDPLLRPASASSNTSTHLSASIGSSNVGTSTSEGAPRMRKAKAYHRTGARSRSRAHKPSAVESAGGATGRADRLGAVSSYRGGGASGTSTTARGDDVRASALAASAHPAAAASTVEEVEMMNRVELARARFQLSEPAATSRRQPCAHHADADVAGHERRADRSSLSARHGSPANAHTPDAPLAIAAVTSASLGDPLATSLLTAYPLAVCAPEVRAFLIDQAGLRYTRVPFPLTTSSASAAAVLAEQLRERGPRPTTTSPLSATRRAMSQTTAPSGTRPALRERLSFRRQPLTSNGTVIRRDASFRSAGALLGSIYHPISGEGGASTLADTRGDDEETAEYGAVLPAPLAPVDLNTPIASTTVRAAGPLGDGVARVSSTPGAAPQMTSSSSLIPSTRPSTTCVSVDQSRTSSRAGPSRGGASRGTSRDGARKADLRVHELPRTFIYYMEQQQQQNAGEGASGEGMGMGSLGAAARGPKAALPTASPFMLYYADHVLKVDISGEASAPIHGGADSKKRPAATARTVSAPAPLDAKATSSRERVVATPADKAWSPLSSASARTPGPRRQALSQPRPQPSTTESISWLPAIGSATTNAIETRLNPLSKPSLRRLSVATSPCVEDAPPLQKRLRDNQTRVRDERDAVDAHAARRGEMRNTSRRRLHVAPRATVRITNITRQESRPRPLVYPQWQQHVQAQQERVQQDMDALAMRERVSRHAYQSEHLRSVQAVRDLMSDTATRKYQRRAREALELREQERAERSANTH